MPQEASEAPKKRSAAVTREKILNAANALFYSEGIRATSADRIIAEASITKVTFYRHFPTKSELVVAYLQQQAEGERSWIRSIRSPGDPAGSLRALAESIGAASCSPGFRGCAFINAAAEFADPEDPVRKTVGAHRQWLLDEFASIAAESGAADPDSSARQLMILRDGAMVNGYLSDPETLAASLEAAFRSVLPSI